MYYILSFLSVISYHKNSHLIDLDDNWSALLLWYSEAESDGDWQVQRQSNYTFCCKSCSRELSCGWIIILDCDTLIGSHSHNNDSTTGRAEDSVHERQTRRIQEWIRLDKVHWQDWSVGFLQSISDPKTWVVNVQFLGICACFCEAWTSDYTDLCILRTAKNKFWIFSIEQESTYKMFLKLVKGISSNRQRQK